MQTKYIDEQLPFSEEEFYRAFRLVEQDGEARENAAFVVQTVRTANEQTARARLAIAAGSQDRSETALTTWIIEDVAFALLALVSDHLGARVDAYMRARWDELREQWLRDGLYRGSGVFLREATPEVHAEVEARISDRVAEWRELLESIRAEVEQLRGQAPGSADPGLAE